jgi:hypothetical protein
LLHCEAASSCRNISCASVVVVVFEACDDKELPQIAASTFSPSFFEKRPVTIFVFLTSRVGMNKTAAIYVIAEIHPDRRVSPLEKPCASPPCDAVDRTDDNGEQLGVAEEEEEEE